MSKSTQANVTVHTNPIYGIRQYRNPLYHLFHSAEGLFKAAIEFFEKSSHLAPKEKREKSARAFYTAAALYIQAQRYDELLTRLEKLDDIKKLRMFGIDITPIALIFALGFHDFFEGIAL